MDGIKINVVDNTTEEDKVVSKLADDTNKEDLIGVVKVDPSKISWQELLDIHKTMAADIIDLQMLVVTMVKTNERVIDLDKELYAVVTGLMKTIDDVALELKDNFERFKDKGNGSIDKENEDDCMLYVEINAAYIATGEKLMNLSSTAITDILTKINLKNDVIVKDAKKLQKDIAEKTAQLHGVDIKE